MRRATVTTTTSVHRSSVAAGASKDITRRMGTSEAMHPLSPQVVAPKTMAASARRGESLRAFMDLGLHEWLAESCVYMGMREPMPIQSACVPAVLAGKDVIGRAATGTGKTAAFALPILQKLSADPYGVFALVLTPTRELAFQISEQCTALGTRGGVRCEVVVGGGDSVAQSVALSNQPHLVVATPGRLLDHFRTAPTECAVVFRRMAVLVLDEADRLLSMGFGDHISALLSELPAPGQRQTLLFSATLSKSLEELQRIAMRKPVLIDAREPPSSASLHPKPAAVAREVDLPAGLHQYHLFVPLRVKDVYLAHAVRRLVLTGALSARWSASLPVRSAADSSAIIFTGSCRSCELLTRMLRLLDVPCASLHSLHSQRRRTAALVQFRSHQVRVLIATDVAGRGLDIPTVGSVINYNVPAAPADYVHRVGRTARAGRNGTAITLVSEYEVERFLAIEALTGVRVPSMEKRATAGDMPAGVPAEIVVREKRVLKELNEVAAARRGAMLELMDTGFLAKDKKRRAAKRSRSAGESAD